MRSQRLFWFSIFFLSLIANSSTAASNPAMVLVTGGEFLMGMQGGEENPAHHVTVDSFLIAIHELTIGEWRIFCDDTKIPFPWNSFMFADMVGRDVGFKFPDDWPIYYVTWYEAVLYCNWRSQKESLKPVYKLSAEEIKQFLYERGKKRPVVNWNTGSDGYRLPTEAEWEYAATGGKSQGEREVLNNSDLKDFGWFRENSDFSAHSVGTKKPNFLGVFDMLGNVGEWCWDYFDPNYYKISPTINPKGPEKGFDPVNFEQNENDIRSNRGCTWMHSIQYCAIQFRYRSEAVMRGPIGIRLVRNTAESTQ